jgi:hypothetical protein
VAKVWFPVPPASLESDQGGLSPVDYSLAYDFVYLAHPRPLMSCAWRKAPDLTPSSHIFVPNILLTSCHDNVCRLWGESAQTEMMRFFIIGWSVGVILVARFAHHFMGRIHCTGRLSANHRFRCSIPHALAQHSG